MTVTAFVCFAAVDGLRERQAPRGFFAVRRLDLVLELVVVSSASAIGCFAAAGLRGKQRLGRLQRMHLLAVVDHERLLVRHRR